MIIPCEVAVKSVVPAVKALMAKELVEKHGLKQNEAAELLGMSQSAVSKYTRKVRGYVVKADGVQEVQVQIASMVTVVTKRPYQRTKFLKLFCQTCTIIRERGLMCQSCLKGDENLNIEECDVCLGDGETLGAAKRRRTK